MALNTTPGDPAADAYVSLEDAKTYADAHGLTFAIAGADAAPAEAAIRRATQWIDARFRTRFAGEPTEADQALEWPRTGVYWRGEKLPGDAIPAQIVNATVEAAVREKARPQSLSPDVTPGKIKKSVSVEGAVSVEYHIGSGSPESQRPDIAVIEGLLAPLLNEPTNSIVGFSARA